MSIRYKFWDEHGTYFVTFAVVDSIDVFTRNEYRNIIIDSIKHCLDNKGIKVDGWVLMTNHLHLLITLQPTADARFSDILRDMKKYTAMQLIKKIKENPQESRQDWMLYIFGRHGAYNSNNTNFQFWRQDNHPIQVNDLHQFSNTLEYIHNNPVRAGFCDDPIAYPWSSAKDYAGKRGLIP